MPRVLFIKPSSLGDIVHGLQVAQSLRAQCPDVEIDWVAVDAFVSLVQASTVVHNVFVFERKRGVPAFLQLAGEIRGHQYDWALDLQGLARSAALLALAHAKHKVGRSDAREGAGWLYQRKAPLPPGGRYAHALDILLQFLPLMGARAELDAAPLEFAPSETVVFPAGLLQRAPVVLFPDSRRKEKQWPGFFELTVRLHKQYPDLPLVWAGNSGPEPELHWPEDKFYNLISRTPIDSLPELIGAARLVVCNDSGPMHLAAALHRPIVALFGPTDHERFGPYPLNDPNHIVIRAPEGKLAQLSVDAVIFNIKKVLDVISLKGPVEKRDGKLVLLIPLDQGGNKFLECSKGISQVEGDSLQINIPDWLAQKLGIQESSVVSVDNKNGKFNITVLES